MPPGNPPLFAIFYSSVFVFKVYFCMNDLFDVNRSHFRVGVIFHTGYQNLHVLSGIL